MIDFNHIKIQHLITHTVGNRSREEGITLADKRSDLLPDTTTHLNDYFLSQFDLENSYVFTHAIELSHNTIYNFCKNLFEDQSSFITTSQKIAQILYDCCEHPKIEQGNFHLCYYRDVQYGDELIDALGFFKAEKPDPFIQIESNNSKFSIGHSVGFPLDKIDKATLVLNVDTDLGYKCLSYDSKSKISEAQFWHHDFLNITMADSEFHQTENIMRHTKNFISRGIQPELELEKTEQIDLMNKSISYFQSADVFQIDDFANEVFKDEQLIDDFKKYSSSKVESEEIQLPQEFSLSEKAVKKNSRIFKSVLKLDKNFHVYIHGDRENIIRGQDLDGRKYYKLYYEEEH